MDKKYQVCTYCVMDTTVSDIVFDENGNCNYCKEFIENMKKHYNYSYPDLSEKRELLLNKIKKEGKNKPYDCIIGVSGGVDSSYVLYLAKQHGLRPLAVHIDNGWNSDLANQNISNLVTKLRVDLYTHVIDWNENKDLQRSFFAANVVDIEMLVDNAIQALNYNQAKENHIRYILGGTNLATEGMRMPPNWNHYKNDKKNILAIQKKYGNLKIKTHPLISTFDLLWNEYIIKYKWISFLDYFDYKKNEALDILVREVAYQPYPYKHYESIFTRFYQGYILPQKFNIDKRRLHFSTLIVTHQMTRDEALKLLDNDPYPDSEQKKTDKEIVINRLGFTQDSFDQYICTPAIPHAYYGSEEWIMRTLISMNTLRKKIISC